MNWTIDYDQEWALVTVSCEGDFTVEDCIGFKKDFMSREYWHPGINVLIDYRKTNFHNLKLPDLERAAAFHIAKNDAIGSGKMAFLMNTLTHFGLARQYELLTENAVYSEVMVFQDEAKAREWLST
jgi:hypothetical protein